MLISQPVENLKNKIREELALFQKLFLEFLMAIQLKHAPVLDKPIETTVKRFLLLYRYRTGVLFIELLSLANSQTIFILSKVHTITHNDSQS